jgi:uncharacterized protein (DUF952 family)
MSRVIYHIAEFFEWERQRPKGEYRHPSLATEGFLHCSLKEQVEGTLDRFFPSRVGLVLLEIDCGKLLAEVRYENGFPHVYGPLNLEAVVAVRDIPVVKRTPR